MGAFNSFANKYDEWFLGNKNLLISEVLLIKKAIGLPGKALSVGCGTGLFEHILLKQYGVEVKYCVEPSEAMRKVAEARGLITKRGFAEEIPYEDEEFDSVLLNGIISYVKDPRKSIQEAYRVLRKGGKCVVAFLPAESPYGILYRLAERLGGWDSLKEIAPERPYPVEFLKESKWKTTEEVMELMVEAGFRNISFYQTLTMHPKYSNNSIEKPKGGYESGSYVAAVGLKPNF